MIEIRLSERDFDYELQALVNSFFPGQRSQVVIGDEQSKEISVLDIYINLEWKKVTVDISSTTDKTTKSATVSGEEDWHKHQNKTTHPYRTYYKNILKKLLFEQLRDFPEDALDKQLVRRIPAWGTMTGVRPTKIAMNEILSGKAVEEVREELEQTYCCSEDKVKLGMDIAGREAALLKQSDFENGYSLYVGIPFCPTTCLYCSFTSYPFEKFGHMAADYLVALKKEIKYLATVYKDKKISSIYVGGGTPTTLNVEQLRELIQCIRECFPVEQSYEFTVEAGRPDSITRDKLQVLYDFGVRRISVNPQTMQQKTLDLIGRKHTVTQIVEAFNLAREIGFDNINMDLIIGLPGETEDDFRDTLRQLEVLDPDSVTIHSLVVKRASRLRSTLEQLGEYGDFEEERIKSEHMDNMLEIGQQFAASHGYKPYYMYRQKNSAGHAGSTGQENIGYARDGKECLYNILIMEEKQTILAAGAGASTKLYHRELGQVSRVENVKSITDYIERIEEMIQRKRTAFEDL